MKSALIGVIIIFGISIIGDFIYTEKNYCNLNTNMGVTEQCKCGFLKKQFNIEIYFFDRLW